MTSSSKDKISYQLIVDAKMWDKFKSCLKKVYWKEDITINWGINRLIKEFVEKHEEE